MPGRSATPDPRRGATGPHSHRPPVATYTGEKCGLDSRRARSRSPRSRPNPRTLRAGALGLARRRHRPGVDGARPRRGGGGPAARGRRRAAGPRAERPGAGRGAGAGRLPPHRRRERRRAGERAALRPGPGPGRSFRRRRRARHAGGPITPPIPGHRTSLPRRPLRRAASTPTWPDSPPATPPGSSSAACEEDERAALSLGPGPRRGRQQPRPPPRRRGHRGHPHRARRARPGRRSGRRLGPLAGRPRRRADPRPGAGAAGRARRPPRGGGTTPRADRRSSSRRKPSCDWSISSTGTPCARGRFRDGSSALAAARGQSLFDPALTLRDDGTDPAGLPFPFDLAGVAKRPLDLVAAGVVATPAVDDELATARSRPHAARPRRRRRASRESLPAPQSGRRRRPGFGRRRRRPVDRLARSRRVLRPAHPPLPGPRPRGAAAGGRRPRTGGRRPGVGGLAAPAVQRGRRHRLPPRRPRPDGGIFGAVSAPAVAFPAAVGLRSLA